MKATFVYSEQEVVAAVMTHHVKKITFAEKNYLIDARFSTTGGKEVVVFVEDRPEKKESKPVMSEIWRWLKCSVLRIGQRNSPLPKKQYVS